MLLVGFSIVWTVFATVLAVIGYAQMEGPGRVLIFLFPAFGILFACLAHAFRRRRRSLRTETANGVTVHVWIGLDGRECRAAADPRPGWSDGDGEGDGGGGD